MSNRFVPALLAGAMSVAAAGCRPAAVADDRPTGRGVDVELRPDTLSVSGLVPRNATLATLLRDQQMRQDVVVRVLTVTRDIFDPRRLKAEHPFHLVRTLDGMLRRFEYEIDSDSFLQVLGDRESDELKATLVPFRKERALVSLHGEINRSAPSLFAAMEAAGERPDLTLELADIFGGEIDFNTDLQPGDRFGLAFEKVYREGRFSSYGPVLAAEFDNEGRRFRAIRFTVPGGKPGYYDEQGRSLRRFFLASPLKFILAPRVSSRFTTARFHPILKIFRPHLGIDYSAPMGAPVVAVAAGTVLSAGWNGEGGRMIHLRHASGYETLYMHLSSISVRAGQHVGQGDTIGRVGSTGMSTGPHLDYRVRKDGRAMNPLNLLRSMPPGEPIPPTFLAQFQAARDKALSRLVEAPTPAATGGMQ
jgi:murein DD-endopeptidase MepM/ murein hydrolase activator NlpD